MGYSEITFYTSKLRTSPKAFAWMMGNGVLYGQLDYVRPDSLLSDVQVNVSSLAAQTNASLHNA